MDHRRWTLRRFCVYFAFSSVLSACASTQSARPPSAVPPGAHDVTCKYVGLEDVSGPNDQNADSVTLMAAYRFGEPAPKKTKEPLSLRFQVQRSRVKELRDHLATRPEVICSPEGATNYAARVDPFEGVRGVPQP
jgi:hypothetical protein